MNHKKYFATLLLGLALSSTVLASNDPDFQAGLQAFRAGDYATALEHFESAQQAGVDSPGLYYNLGVVHYRLGHYEQARQAFTQAAASQEFASLAQYNLGLVALKQGDQQRALAAFRKAQEGKDIAVLRLADEQIARIEKASKAEPDAWNFSFGIYGGYDDSIVDPVTQIGTTTGDSFTEIFVGTRGIVSGDSRRGVRLDLAGYFVRYAEEDSNDADVFRAGLSGLTPLGRWQTETSIQLERSALGGEGYLQAAHLVASGYRPLLPAIALLLDYRFTALQALETVYEPQEGIRHKLDMALRGGDFNNYLEAGYRFEHNDREDLQEGTLFTSYSPTRHEVRIRGRGAISGTLGISGEIAQRESRYNDPDRFADGSLITREDSRTSARLMLTGRLGTRWEMELGYEHNDNDSNIAAYDYTQNLYWIGVSGLF